MPKTSCLFKKPKISMNLASISINKRKIYEEKLNNDEDNFDEPKKNQIRILLKRVCENKANEIFRRDDFPSVNIGKTKTVNLLAYWLWKMERRSENEK